MSVMICQECEDYIDTDLDDFDFEIETCRRCVESKQPESEPRPKPAFYNF